jgi:hypothetical protein
MLRVAKFEFFGEFFESVSTFYMIRKILLEK